jgi:hypothetical protein
MDPASKHGRPVPRPCACFLRKRLAQGREPSTLFGCRINRTRTAQICGFPCLKSETWGAQVQGYDCKITRARYSSRAATLCSNATTAQAICLSRCGELWVTNRGYRAAASTQAFSLLLPLRDRSLARPVIRPSLGDRIIVLLEKSPPRTTGRGIHHYVKGCGSVPCGHILCAGATLGSGARCLEASVTSRSGLLEEFPCIFWIALLPRTRSIYPRSGAESTVLFAAIKSRNSSRREAFSPHTSSSAPLSRLLSPECKQLAGQSMATRIPAATPLIRHP